MFYFIIKHYICDYVLQNFPTEWIALNKAKNIWAMIIHCIINGAGTFVVVLIIIPDIKLALAIGLLDGIIHYVIDGTRVLISTVKTGRVYFLLLGADQMLHLLWYALIVYFLEHII